MKSPSKHKYEFYIYFRKGNDEKDWIDYTFEESSFKEAYEKAMNWTRFVFKVELCQFDNKKVFKYTSDERYYYLEGTKMEFVK